jgi:hypothetical protein
MPDTPTVAELFRAAGARLRVEFQAARESSFHAGQTGAEVEEILRKFLNEHLPQRFRATAAFLIDSENAVSKQCDIAIYDAEGSPVLRSSPGFSLRAAMRAEGTNMGWKFANQWERALFAATIGAAIFIALCLAHWLSWGTLATAGCLAVGGVIVWLGWTWYLNRRHA